MKVGIIQQQCSADLTKNIESAVANVQQAGQQGAELVILPELHNTRYFCQTHNPEHFALAEPIPGPTTQKFSQLAKALSCVLVISLFEKRSKGLYHNTAVVIEQDGSIAGRYRKMHIPDDPGYHEKYYFSPGDQGFVPIATSVGRLGILICWDQWFPEAARMQALAGASILLAPTAIGWEPADSCQEKERQVNAWQTIQQAHAIANHIPIVAANRVGFEPRDYRTDQEGIEFWGNSFIADSFGTVLVKASSSVPGVMVADVDRIETEALRQTWPFFRDRRVDAYWGLCERYLG